MVIGVILANRSADRAVLSNDASSDPVKRLQSVPSWRISAYRSASTIGLYEVLITAGLDARLAKPRDRLSVDRDALHVAEARHRIALHLGRTIERASRH